MNNNQACADYFKKRPEYRRCFRELEKKWRSYGKVAGRITLMETSEEERHAIRGIVGRAFPEETVSFSFAEFEAGLQRTRYAPIDMEKVLEAYCGKSMETNQEKQKAEKRKKEEFFERIERYLKETEGEVAPGLFWLKKMLSGKKCGYQIVNREYGKNPDKAEELLINVGKVLAELQKAEETGEEYPLAVFASQISGNPHYLDRGTTAGQLLIHGICNCKNMEFPKSAFGWRELLWNVGIVPDNISSLVHVCGLRIQIKRTWHPAYEAFCERNEPCVITMENLQGITAVKTVGTRIYMVENEMVFSYLLKNKKRRDVTLICTSGQIRSAAIKLLPFLLDSGAEIYYSGDIDPDGIGIADRLWKKFGDRIHIWRMSEQDYEASLSEEQISDAGIKKLEHITHPILCETAKAVRETGRAGYQENILNRLLEDINFGTEIRYAN